MELQITRPICFLDVETTGVNVEEDRIVEIGIFKKFPDGLEETKSRRINPGIPIPQSASEVHGITDELVKDCPKFINIAKGMHDFISGCDLAGFNCNSFDFPLLFHEFARAGINWNYQDHFFIDMGNLYKIREPRTLGAAYKFYVGKDLENAHDASVDIKATYDVFVKQLTMYDDLPKDIKELSLYSNYGKEIVDISGKFVKDEQGDYVFNFGSHKGKKAKTEKKYLEWMLKPSSKFSADTKRIANLASFH